MDNGGAAPAKAVWEESSAQREQAIFDRLHPVVREALHAAAFPFSSGQALFLQEVLGWPPADIAASITTTSRQMWAELVRELFDVSASRAPLAPPNEETQDHDPASQ